MYVTIVLLAIALSLDSFSVGFTYGLRSLRIPFLSTVIIAFCSACVMVASMYIGVAISHVFSPNVAQKIGGFVLIAIGSWVLYQFFQPEKQEEKVVEEKTLINFEIKSIGLAIQILKKPTVADIDRSGTISSFEALLLGIALSFDSFGAGIGVSLLGYSPLLMGIVVGIMCCILLNAGRWAGKLFSTISWIQRFTFLPGVLLIIIGIWKL
ncbi:MAG: sporulation membrane protein YtaF [Bacillaceae bacterium]